MLRSLLVSSLLAAPCFAASAADWSKRSIYQVVTDRFATSDQSTPSCDASKRTYCGGTFKGLTSKLDYIQAMGFDAVWISPITTNLEGSPLGDAYHGYWPTDINTVNKHFGTADDLKELSAALHKRDMYLMLDVVVNHYAATSVPPNLDFSKLAPFGKEADFHPQCWVTDYANQTQVEQCWLGDANVPLVDLDTENQEVQTIMNSWITKLVSDYSADGIRIDTVKHVRADFWPEFVKAAGVFSIGEVLNGDIKYMDTYTRVMDAVLDYTTFFPLTRAFTNSSGSFPELITAVETAQSTFKNGEFGTGSFLESHDQARFQSRTKDKGLVRNAATFSFIHDGIPIVYYGQEQDYAGGEDPENREALWNVDYVNTKAPLVEHFTKLNKARKAAIKADSTFLTTKMKFLKQSDAKAMVITKGPMTALFTNSGSGGTASWTVPDATFKNGEALVDVLDSCKAYTATGSGGLQASANAGMPKVLMAASTGSDVCSSTGTAVGAQSSSFKSSIVSAWAVVALVGSVGLLL